jgi:hypothetical protein
LISLPPASALWCGPGRSVIPRLFRPAGTWPASTSARPVRPAVQSRKGNTDKQSDRPWLRRLAGPATVTHDPFGRRQREMPTGLRQLFTNLVDKTVKFRDEGAAAASERGIVVYANGQLVDLVGRPRAQLVGSPRDRAGRAAPHAERG